MRLLKKHVMVRFKCRQIHWEEFPGKTNREATALKCRAKSGTAWCNCDTALRFKHPTRSTTLSRRTLKSPEEGRGFKKAVCHCVMPRRPSRKFKNKMTSGERRRLRGRRGEERTAGRKWEELSLEELWMKFHRPTLQEGGEARWIKMQRGEERGGERRKEEKRRRVRGD